MVGEKLSEKSCAKLNALGQRKLTDCRFSKEPLGNDVYFPIGYIGPQTTFYCFTDRYPALPHDVSMQTIVELPEFLLWAKQVGLSEEERAHIIETLAAQPNLGDEIAGTGGMRKLRGAAKGKGKSGGYRVITFFSGPLMPVFLMTVYAKSQKYDITEKKKHAMKSLSAILIDSYKRERT